MHASRLPALKLVATEMAKRGTIQKMCNAEAPSPSDGDGEEMAEEEAPQEEDAPEGDIEEEKGTS